MRVYLDEKAPEKGTYVVDVTFKDEDKFVVAPKTMKWSLTDSYGTAINVKTETKIETPGSTETIVLTGNDLWLSEGLGLIRVLSFVGTYDSSTASDLALTEEVWFEIKPRVAVT